MLRRKPSGFTAGTKKGLDEDFRDVEGGEPSSPPSSLPGQTRQYASSRPQRKKKGQSVLCSCLLRLRLLSDRKKIESSLTRGGGSKKKMFDRMSFCVLFLGLICVLLVVMGLYYALARVEEKSSKIVLPSNQMIPRDLVSSTRPDEDGNLIPMQYTGSRDPFLPVNHES